MSEIKRVLDVNGNECTVPATVDVNAIPKAMLYQGNPNMKRINVRDQWTPSKILGTLPWDGKETEQRFSWQTQVNGCPTQQILKLQVNRLIAGDVDEMAYMNGGHGIEVLRKLPEFQEKVDER